MSPKALELLGIEDAARLAAHSTDDADDSASLLTPAESSLSSLHRVTSGVGSWLASFREAKDLQRYVVIH